MDSKRCHWLAGLSLLFFFTAHVGYQLADPPLELAPDEAHYWDWSRQLDLNYYSKGPIVAWVIRASWEAWRPLVESGHVPAVVAVRFPAALFAVLLLAGVYCLAIRVIGAGRPALYSMLAAMTVPPVSAAATVMTIDAPYTAFWTWAIVCGYDAIFKNRNWAWIGAGCFVAVGSLAKYTMVLWLPAVGLFFLTTPQFRRRLWSRGFLTSAAIAALSGVPVLIWNIQNDWVTFRHVSQLAGGPGESRGIRWLGPLQFLTEQYAMLLGVWFIAWAGGMITQNPLKQADPVRRYLWWLSAVVFGVFLMSSFKTAGQVNWPVAAYIPGLMLATIWLRDRFAHWSESLCRLWTAGFGTAAFGGLAIAFLMHAPDVTRPVFAKLAGPECEQHPVPLRRLDPTCRLRGWKTLAAAVDAKREALERQGIQPLIAAGTWFVPGELAFYCQDRPQVFSFAAGIGQRHSQYDLWRPNPVADHQAFLGRTFVYVGESPAELVAAFDYVETPKLVVHREDGHAVAAWYLTIAHRFKGFPKTERTIKARY